VDLPVNPLGPTVLINTSLNAEKLLMFLMYKGGAKSPTWSEGRDEGTTVTSREGGVASNTESSLVSIEARTAKRFGEVKVLVFFPLRRGEFEEVLDNILFDDVGVRGGLLPERTII